MELMPFVLLEPRTSPTIEDGLGSTEDWDRALEKSSTYVLPLASVLVSASMGLFTFLSSASGSANTVSPVLLWSGRHTRADSGLQTFQWLVAVTSVASLHSWAGMLYTYIRYGSALRVRARTSRVLMAVWDRWHQGTTYVEKKCQDPAEMSPEERESAMIQIEVIKKNRQWGQPYVSAAPLTCPCGRILMVDIARVVRVLIVHVGALHERLVRCLCCRFGS